jgi:hypothetical protein
VRHCLDPPAGTVPTPAAIEHTGRPGDNSGLPRLKARHRTHIMIVRDASIARDTGV